MNKIRKEKITGIGIAILIFLFSITVLLTQEKVYWAESVTKDSVAAPITSDPDLQVIWNRTWGGELYLECGRSIWSDGTYLYTCGWTGDYPGGDVDLLLIKWDTDGNILWNQTWAGGFHDYGYSIWADGTYLYTCGWTGVFPSGDLLLIKWDTDGNILWNQTWGGSSNDYGYSIWGDGTYLYTLGSTSSFGAGNDDFALVKWDTNGNIIWNKTWGGGSSDDGHSIWGDGTYLYTLGSTSSFGAGNDDFALVKWDTNGNILRYKTWGGSSNDNGISIWGDGTYLYTLGSTKSFGAGLNDLALVKWDTNGNILWDKNWGGGDTDQGISIWGDGTYLYTVGYTGYNDFEHYAPDLLLIKWDTNGNIVSNNIWGLDGYWDIGYSVWGDGTYLYTCGETTSLGPGNLVLIKWGLDTITDIIVPTLSTPSDITYEQGTTGHSITWIATDINPDICTIYKDGIEITSGKWTSGIPITTNVDVLSIGSYTYSIVVFDVSGNSAIDTVIVTVIVASPEDSPVEDQGIPGYSLNILVIVVIAVITIVILKQKLKH